LKDVACLQHPLRGEGFAVRISVRGEGSVLPLAEAAEPGAPARPCPCPLPSGDTALSRLVRRLLSARSSLDLCLFSFSCPQLARAVQLLHRRGVRVRLVTDAQYMGLHGSQIGRLRHAGIQVRHDQHSGYMHHKFAIVDRRMLITGSLNWTTQAIQSNRENVLVVEDAELAELWCKSMSTDGKDSFSSSKEV
uniref:Mitochondrial cardiolipin hydrolase n=1 Tax=Ficedula albicollis TaxID=59894 RepID=A0A803VRM8_FICAL